AMQQRLDPVDVGAALLDQPLALAMPALGILRRDAWRPCHAAHPRLAPAMGEKHPHQLLQIDPIGLGPSLAAVYLDARRVEHMVDHALLLKPAVQPKPVIAGLVAGNHANPPRTPCLRLPASCLNQSRNRS